MTDIDRALDDAFTAVFGAAYAAAKVEAAKGGREDQFTRPTRREMATPKLTAKLAINSPAWREQVKHRLLDGYGSQDIAIWLDCHAIHVTKEVQRLRADGSLEKWFTP
jgi:hypothetical protein